MASNHITQNNKDGADNKEGHTIKLVFKTLISEEQQLKTNLK